MSSRERVTASDGIFGINEQAWGAGDYVKGYATRDLRPVEVVLLARYGGQRTGRTLELGCGAGRLLGYLSQLSGEAHGVDLSPRMVDYCRSVYPAADVRIGNLIDPDTWGAGRFESIWAAACLIDVLDDPMRQTVLARIGERLAPGGVLIFSSHNLDSLGQPGPGGLGRIGELAWTPPATTVKSLLRAPLRRRNRRALAARQEHHEEYAVINDEAQDYALLHYYIGRDAQEAQLAALGWHLVECLDLQGEAVARGERSRDPELHYIAVREAESAT